MTIRYIHIAFLLLGCQLASSQDFPIFSQYVSNGLLLNPAYSGSREVLSINFSHRNHMVGFDGAPVFQTLSVHAPLKNDALGLGMLFLHEQSGPSSNIMAFGSFAYRIPMGKARLALGIKAGFHYAQFNWKNVFTNENDPAFSSPTQSYLLPNAGAGIYYYSRRFFSGISIPYFLSYKENTNSSGFEMYHDFKNYTFLITSGYLLNFSRNFKLKPTFLLKYYTNQPVQLDMNLNIILFNDKLWIGSAYRVSEAMAGLVEFQINPQLRFGYTFEYAGKQADNFNYTSHEIGIRYEFAYKIKAFNPRYF